VAPDRNEADKDALYFFKVCLKFLSEVFSFTRRSVRLKILIKIHHSFIQLYSRTGFRLLNKLSSPKYGITVVVYFPFLISTLTVYA